MADLESLARPATEKLEAKQTDDLYLEIGMRLQEIRRDPALAGDFDLTAKPDAEGMGANQLSELGRQYFRRVSTQSYDLVCGAEAPNTAERENLLKKFGLGKEAVAPALAALLVAHLALAPAIAAVIAAIAVRLFFKPGYDLMCEAWKKNLPKA
jgi:hypothetical protein